MFQNRSTAIFTVILLSMGKAQLKRGELGLMSTEAAQCSPGLCMNDFSGLMFCLPLKKKNKKKSAFGHIYVHSLLPGQLSAAGSCGCPSSPECWPTRSVPSSQSAPIENCSQRTGFRAVVPWRGGASWVCGTYHTDIPMNLQCISFFPLFRTTCQQVPGEWFLLPLGHFFCHPGLR